MVGMPGLDADLFSSKKVVLHGNLQMNTEILKLPPTASPASCLFQSVGGMCLYHLIVLASLALVVLPPDHAKAAAPGSVTAKCRAVCIDYKKCVSAPNAKGQMVLEALGQCETYMHACTVLHPWRSESILGVR